MKKLKIKLTFTEDVLGGLNNNDKVFEEFHKPKAPVDKQAEEAEATVDPAASNDMEKMTTVFPKNPDGSKFCWDYQVRGFFKEAMTVGCELGEEVMKSLSKWTIKKTVDSMLFIEERRIPFIGVDGLPVSKVRELERPLRAQTMRGERICLARSEVIDAGSSIVFTVGWLESKSTKGTQRITEDAITWALNYGALKGFGQWRGGGWGRFRWEAAEGA